MTVQSLELRDYRHGGYISKVEFFSMPTPFVIEEGKTVMVFTQGFAERFELVMTCDIDAVYHTVEILDAVIRDRLADDTVPEGMIALDDGSGKLYSLVEVSSVESATGLMDHYVGKRPLTPRLLQVYWPDSVGNLPHSPAYMHDLVPQPVLV